MGDNGEQAREPESLGLFRGDFADGDGGVETKWISRIQMFFEERHGATRRWANIAEQGDGRSRAGPTNWQSALKAQ